jgi:hypothetical protein
MRGGMKRLFLSVALPAALWAQPPQTALEALQVLPKQEAARLAQAEAHEEGGAPDRWHFLTYDPTAENGFREYVVADREIVAIREVSQFATRIGPGDVLGAEPARVDSDAVAVLARDYARALGVSVQSLNYKLCKDPQKAGPVWRVVCRGPRGDALGELSVTAGLGEVTVPEGFGNSAATDPPAAVVKRPAPPQPTPTRENAVAQSRPSPPTQVRRARTKAPPPGKGSPPRDRSSTAASVPARTAKTPPAPAAPEPNLFRRFLQRVAPPARGSTATAGTGDSRNSRPAEAGTR